MTSTITLYTMSWGGYCEKYGEAWSNHVNRLSTVPDEVIVVSDTELNLSSIKITKNVRNVVTETPAIFWPVAHYRNVAVSESTSDWVVSSDVDDEPFSNYLDDLCDDADIHAFSFIGKNKSFYPDQSSLLSRLSGNSGGKNLIPSNSAIKKDFLKN